MEGLRLVGQDLTTLKKKLYQERPARRSVRRPEQVVRDVRGLKLRQRVSLVLNDKILREELEDIVKSYSENGPRYQAIRAYQDFLVPTPPCSGAGLPAMTLTPIADIRGSETLNYTKQERLLRCKVAAVYRLIDLLGWSQGIYNHITARTSSEEAFLINPFGLLYSEITASSLVKCDKDGNILDEGRTSLGINAAGFALHSVLHEARKDIKCIIHVHTPAGAAIAATKCGILPISQEALLLGEVSYHDYHGLVSLSEKEELVNSLGEKNKVMVLRNHGLVAVGETVEEAFHYIYHAIKACEIQVQAMPAGIDNLIKIEASEIQEEVPQNADKTMAGKSKWGCGELQFEAYMRLLDGQGYNTGYAYHCPEMYNEAKQKPSEVREPPTVTSFRYNLLYGPERERGQASRRVHSAGRANTYKNRAKWLNSPVKGTEYKKEKRVIEEEIQQVDAPNEEEVPEKIDKETEKPKEQKKVQINTEGVVIKSSKVISHEDEPKTIVQEEKTVSQDGHEITTIITTTTTSSSEHKEVTTMVNGDEKTVEAEEGTSQAKDDSAKPDDGNALKVNQAAGEPESPKKGDKVKKTSSFKKAFKHLKIKKKEGKNE